MTPNLQAQPHHRLASSRVRLAALFGIVVSFSIPIVLGQSTAGFPVSGYTTSIRPATGPITELDVSGDIHVTVTPTTGFGILGHAAASSTSSLRDEIQIGTFIAVSGELDKRTHTAHAQAIYLRGGAELDKHPTISGVGVIDKVISTGPELTFRADGYILRVPADADLTFSDSLSSLADIGTNV